tara:strand:- start:497 stop:1267 length:771 start_codon:yes stop_codon:yes gene_type:complete
MNFSFGILTSKLSDKYLDEVIDSIYSQKIPNYEVVLIGETNKNYKNKNIKQINFDESKKEGWITKKKNIITNESRYSNIVYMHDYLKLDASWYEGYMAHGDDFKVCTNKILTNNNQRYRDWTFWQLNNTKFDEYFIKTRGCLVPYHIKNLSKYMYISGAYWVAKKDFMTKNKLNEQLLWGEGEDVEWSKRVRKKIEFDFNEFSTVKLLKEKEVIFKEIDDEKLKEIIDYDQNIIKKMLDKSKIYTTKILKKTVLDT